MRKSNSFSITLLCLPVLLHLLVLFGCSANSSGSDESSPQGTVSVTGISLNKNSLSLAVPNTEQLVAQVLPANATNKQVVWSSSNSAVASVNAAGVVTAVSAGSATISATTVEGGFSSGCTVAVTFISLTGITLNKSALSLTIPDSEQLIVTYSPADASNKNVIWTSSDTSHATVDSNGTVTAAGTTNGSAIITATAADGGFTASCTVSVTFIAVTGVTLNKSSTTIKIPNTEQLVATVSPVNASNKDVTWMSSNTSCATVNSSGLVTAKGTVSGNSTITVTTVDGGKTASCAATITFVPVNTVSLNKTSTSIVKGGTEQLSATVEPTDASIKDLTWSSTDGNVASVSSAGLVTGVNVGGPVNIIASATDGSGKSATCNVSVTAVLVSSITLNKSSTSLNYPNTETLTVVSVLPENATDKTVSWSSLNTGIATVDAGTGLVSAVNGVTGTAEIRATANDGSGVYGSCTVTVPPIAVTGVSVSPTTLGYMISGQLTATVYPSNATNKNVTWSSADTGVATVDATGYVTNGGIYGTSTVITVTTVDGGYTATCTVSNIP